MGCNCVSFKPNCKKVDEYLIPHINKHFPNSKKAAQISRGTGIFVAVVLLISIITALCNMMLPELYKSIWNMVSTVPSQLNTAVDQITKMMSKDTTTGQLYKCTHAGDGFYSELDEDRFIRTS